MRMVRTPDAKATYLDSAVLDTGDLLSSTPGGHHGARHLLVAGQGHQVQAPICAPCRSGSQQSWWCSSSGRSSSWPCSWGCRTVQVKGGARGDHQVPKQTNFVKLFRSRAFFSFSSFLLNLLSCLHHQNKTSWSFCSWLLSNTQNEMWQLVSFSYAPGIKKTS